MLKTLEKRKESSSLIRIYFEMFYRRSIGDFRFIVHRIIDVINFFQNFCQISSIAQVHYTLVYQSNKI